MIFGYLSESDENIIFNNYDQGNTTTTLKHLVNGNLDYLPLRTLVKKLPRELGNVVLVINGDSDRRKLKPNLLIEEDIVLGNIVIINVDEEGKTKGLTDSQVKSLPSVMNKLIIPRQLGMVFGY